MPERKDLNIHWQSTKQWLMEEYFIPRLGGDAYESNAPRDLTNYLIYHDPAYEMESGLRGILAEIYGRAFLEWFSPGYGVTISPLEMDLAGIDILITPENSPDPVGGFDITTNTRRVVPKEEERLHTPIERVVLPVLYAGVGTIRQALEQQGEFNLNAYIDRRIRNRDGIRQVGAMMSQLERVVSANQRAGVDTKFSSYLLELVSLMGDHYDMPPRLT